MHIPPPDDTGPEKYTINPDSAGLQFQKAEYQGVEPAADRCRTCGKMLDNQYYRVKGEMACDACADRARRALPAESHAAFVRALLFGAGGALAGLILYSTVAIVTGQIGRAHV